jgi:hypothetical protein
MTFIVAFGETGAGAATSIGMKAAVLLKVFRSGSHVSMCLCLGAVFKEGIVCLQQKKFRTKNHVVLCNLFVITLNGSSTSE